MTSPRSCIGRRRISSPRTLRVHDMIRKLLELATATGDVCTDVPPAGPTDYCMNGLGAAATMPTEAAVRRLVAVTHTRRVRPEPIELNRIYATS